MSDLSNQAQKLLGRFSKTVDVMKSAYSKDDKEMSVWAEDIYAVEAVMSFLETIRDAPAQSGQKIAPDEQGARALVLENAKLREEVEKWHRVAMEAGAITCLGGGHIYPLKDEVKLLRGRVEGAITTFKAIYAKTPHPDIAEMAFNAIQTLSSTEQS